MQYSYFVFLCVKNIFLSLHCFKSVYDMFLCKYSENILVIYTNLKELWKKVVWKRRYC